LKSWRGRIRDYKLRWKRGRGDGRRGKSLGKGKVISPWRCKKGKRPMRWYVRHYASHSLKAHTDLGSREKKLSL
jgi:hypothetical protein